MANGTTILLESQYQSFADHLVTLSEKRISAEGVTIETEALKDFTEYVSGAFDNIQSQEYTLDFRITMEVRLMLFVDKMIQQANHNAGDIFTAVITKSTFERIKSLFCPGFFPFC